MNVARHASPVPRTLVVGDVHGCIEELDALLAKAGFREGKERLIFIGDLVGKGPAPCAVYQRYRRLGAEAILGNHEWQMLEWLGCGGESKKSMRALRDAFGAGFDDFVDEVRTWPLWIETDDFLAVHGGLLPGRSPAESNPADLVNIRTWDGRGEDLQDPGNPPWFDLYPGPKVVVFGHWALLGGVVRENVIGLDTGCVYGGRLSLVIFPGREILSVPARRTYCPTRAAGPDAAEDGA